MAAADGTLLDRALDAWLDGDPPRALRLLSERLDREPGDAEALALRAEIEAAESGVGHDPETPEGGVPFHCLACGNTGHDVREVLLNSRTLSLIGREAADRSADCFVCRTCGLVHWFLRAAPGALQAMHPARPAAARGDASAGGCLVCGFDRGYNRSQLVNTRGMTLLGLDAFNPRAGSLVCARCGHMHWHQGAQEGWHLRRTHRLPPDPPLARSTTAELAATCLACDGRNIVSRSAVLNSRVMTLFGLDWADAGARLASCLDCGYVSWFARGD